MGFTEEGSKYYRGAHLDFYATSPIPFPICKYIFANIYGSAH